MQTLCPSLHLGAPRSDATKKKYIGLSIVKQFICLDMGYLQINVGPGTLFKKYPQVLSFDIQRGCMNEYKKT